MVSVYNIIYNSKKKKGRWGGHKLSLCELLNLFITSVGLMVCSNNLSNSMVIILVALQISDPMSNRIYLYRHKKNLLAFGECVSVRPGHHKLPLYPYQNIVCKKIDFLNPVWIIQSPGNNSPRISK